MGSIIEVKKAKFKEWQKAKGCPEEEMKLEEYGKAKKEAKKEAKKAVAKAQQQEKKKFGDRLDTKEGQRSVFRIAKQMAGERKDIVDMKCLKNEKGEILIEADAVNERWKKYMERLLNVENDWNGVLEGDRVEGPCELISEREVEEAIRDMKAGKAGGPSEVVGEMLKAAGRKGVRMMTELCNQVVREGKIPSEWELSTLILIYKGKGDPII